MDSSLSRKRSLLEDDIASSSASTSSSLPPCKYGSECYRKNPEHFANFSHPDDEKFGVDVPPKKLFKKEDDDLTSYVDSIDHATSPCLPFYLTKVTGIEDTYNRPDFAIGIKDILSPSMGKLEASAQFNYMFDVPWLIEQYPATFRDKPLLLVHGDQREALAKLRCEADPFPQVKLMQARLEIMYGTHHSKMMLLAYEDGLRVVIHTANLIARDWHQKSQGVWISRKFPNLSKDADTVQTGFKTDLLDYLSAYQNKGLSEWIERIKQHDLSQAGVRLVASVPGAHCGRDMLKWGHMKMRKILSQHGPTSTMVNSGWPIIGQFSSIGSLGPTSSHWLTGEWLASLSSTRGASITVAKTAKLHLVFPTVENVKNSLEGYMAGGSIPYSSQNAQKQSYLTNYMCHWKAAVTGRTRASPHIKTYARTSDDYTKLSWLLLTSANLSKAAWGGLEKKGTQLKIRSYEIGVLFTPENESYSISTSTPHSGQMRLPYDVPLTSYSASDCPWVWNNRYLQPDCLGQVWTPS
ncbi:tyrosyl-DNA phosphodiesterase 1-like [Dysidea avara]|uniref:tyrosyl-DNA phosphodiesterase 1-like n=1 Tax=Dysidea avara TaxID=196820 RepID=UPI00331EF279